MLKKLVKCARGFTLIELLIVMTIIGILAMISVPNYRIGVIHAREAVLREDLYMFRTAIDQFWADQGKYPDSLQDLVDRGYIKTLPKDPFTKEPDWVVMNPPADSDPNVKGSVYDVHSNSPLKDSEGKPYNEY